MKFLLMRPGQGLLFYYLLKLAVNFFVAASAMAQDPCVPQFCALDQSVPQFCALVQSVLEQSVLLLLLYSKSVSVTSVSSNK